MIVQRAKLKDAKCVANLSIALFESGKSFDPLLKKVRKRHVNRWIRNKLKDRKARIFVSIDEAKIIGYCIGIIERRPYCFKVSQVGYIWECFVAKEYRNKGVGKALIHKLLSWFRLNGIRTVEIDVYSKNKDALKFWKSFGFKEIRKRMRVKVY